ncbi:HlyD family type I secretion periplasmic adaptor subunit [Thioclava sp. GXIMD2076]|uniref:Membrane fusion protein (MFP) family protein n=1 Tax=Thioclava kandeliae TaxID=3070818 RepID=A0ABV1SGA4_9RHOB
MLRNNSRPPLRAADLTRRIGAKAHSGGAQTPRPQPQIAAKDRTTYNLLVLGYAALFVLVVIFGSWASLTKIAGAVIVSGRLEFDTNRQVVQHPEGGRVEEIFVNNGDKVSAGDILIKLDGQDLQPELTILQDQLFALQARRARLNAERLRQDQLTYPETLTQRAESKPGLQQILSGQTTLFEARNTAFAQMLMQLDRKAIQAEDRIIGIDAQIKSVQQQQVLLAEELQTQGGIADTTSQQRARRLSFERELAVLYGQNGQLIAKQAETREDITTIELQKLQILSQRQVELESELHDIDRQELQQMEQVRNLRNKIKLLDIRAPIDGIVHEMATTTRLSVLRPADPVLYLIPQDRPMMIEIRIPPMNIDEIRQGQLATLRLPGLAARDVQELTGSIQRISPDASIDPVTATAYYRAEVMPDARTEAIMAQMPLLPGMPVEAYLRTTDRTPLTYILAPFLSYLDHAFRES